MANMRTPHMQKKKKKERKSGSKTEAMLEKDANYTFPRDPDLLTPKALYVLQTQLIREQIMHTLELPFVVDENISWRSTV